MQPVFALHRPCAPRCFAPRQLSRRPLRRQHPPRRQPWSSPVELARSPLPRLGLPRQRQLNLQRLRSEAPDRGGSPASSSSSSSATPGLVEANFVYCLGVCWLVFLTDMSGVGPLLLASDNVALSLALLQWGAFVLPVLATSVAARFDLPRTFALRPCSAQQLAGGLLGGASLWTLLSAAVALRAGVTPEGAEASYRLVESISTVWAAPETATQWAALVGLGALAPSAAEELLFRGYLLTAIRSRLGAVDAAAVCAMLFACFHMSLSQFFPTAVLGLAAGLATVSSGSVAPAIALHAAHNAAALVWGAGMAEGVLPPGPPGSWAVALAVLGAGGAVALLRPPTTAESDSDDGANGDASPLE